MPIIPDELKALLLGIAIGGALIYTVFFVVNFNKKDKKGTVYIESDDEGSINIQADGDIKIVQTKRKK